MADNPPLWLSLSAAGFIGWCLHAAVAAPIYYPPALVVAALLASSLYMSETYRG